MKPIAAIVLIALSLNIQVPSGLAQAEPTDKTLVTNTTALKQLLGNHKLNLQWIGWQNWRDFGNAKVVDRDGTLFIKGKQTKGENFLTIDGKITRVDAKQFTFQGKIVTRVNDIESGQACERDGEMVFKITQNRKYWRLQQMQSPCSTVTDYVDIFMR